MELFIKKTAPALFDDVGMGRLTAHLEKAAMRTLLTDNQNTWPSELLAQLYRQHPYLGRYQISIEMQNQDPSAGYMWGFFVVTQAPDVPMMDPNAAQQGQYTDPSQAPTQMEAQRPTVRIPLIVENKKTFSFDVFVTPDGRYKPLSEDRLAAALFDANGFVTAPMSAMTAAAGSQAQGGNGFEPNMPQSADGSTGYGNRGYKTASARDLSVFDVVCVPGEQVGAFFEKMGQDEAFVEAVQYGPNGYLREALRKLAASSENVHVPEEPESAEITTMLLTKTAGGYHVTTMDERGAIATVGVSNAQAEAMHPSVRQHVLSRGFAIITDNEEPLGLVEDTMSKTASVEGSGFYQLTTRNGRHDMEALVFSNVVGLDGEPAERQLVITPGGGLATQEKTAGVLLGNIPSEGVDLGASEQPTGYGVFFFPKLAAFSTPLHVHASVRSGNSGVYYEATDPTFGRIKLAFTSHTDKPYVTSTRDGNFAIVPGDARFIRGEELGTDVFVGDAQARQLHTTAAFTDKIASVQMGEEGYVFGGALGHLEGELSGPDAAFALAAHGDTEDGAIAKLAHVQATRTRLSFFINPPAQAEEFVKSAVSPEVEEYIAELCHADLVKEAAEISSSVGPQTVDAVLSLNFINSETINTYMSAIPELEVAQEKLCELLLGVRIGLKDISEQAVSNAVAGMERAIVGLKKLQTAAASASSITDATEGAQA